jgi:hypothetical protein
MSRLKARQSGVTKKNDVTRLRPESFSENRCPDQQIESSSGKFGGRRIGNNTGSFSNFGGFLLSNSETRINLQIWSGKMQSFFSTGTTNPSSSGYK